MKKLTKTAHMGPNEHTALKSYCQEHEISIFDVLNGLANYIVLNKVDPKRFLKPEEGDLISVEERLIKEIKKNRDEIKKSRETYVSFQRTYEKRYQLDMYYLKEAVFLGIKKTLAAVLRGEAKDRITQNTVTYFLRLYVEELLQGYEIKEKLALELIKEEGANLFKKGNVSVYEIERRAIIIFNQVGIKKIEGVRKNP